MSLTKASYSMVNGAPANVLDYGADLTGATDSSAAFQAAANTGKSIFIPAGTYKCNFTVSKRTIIFGEGSYVTILKPNNVATAIITETTNGHWAYSTEVHGIQFNSTGKTGVGYTFGKTNPADYATGDELVGNTKFFGCYFGNLDKGVQFPFGNIGSEFYSCGFSANRYGVYSLNNKFGSIMHAGNKYFYAGEFDQNYCAVYVDNTCDGFGGFSFTDTIFEYNALVCSINNTYTAVSPIQFKDCWNESNGLAAGLGTTVTIDAWSGTTKSTQTVPVNQAWRIGSDQVVFDGGFVAGLFMTKQGSQAFVSRSRVEQNSGYGGSEFQAISQCRIYFKDCQTSSGFNSIPQCVDQGYTFNMVNDSTTTNAASARLNYLPLVYATHSGTANGGVSAKLLTAAAYTGTSSGTGTQVSDSVKYATCNEFTYNFTSASYRISPTSTLFSAAPAGWYAYSFDIRVTAGTLTCAISNLSTHQLGTITITADGVWHTVGGVCYVDAGTPDLSLWFGGDVSNCTWRLSAYQLRSFSTQGDAVEFLSSHVYLE